MIKAIAIDDEKHALGVIREYCKRIDDITLVEGFTQPDKGMAYAHAHADLNLVFMDIQMANANGLALTKQLPAHCRVIITTAHPEYAVEGYELDILDYLVKPFTLERFDRALRKYRALEALRHQDEGSSKTIKRLTPSGDDIIFVRTGYKVVKVRLDEIRLIEGAGNYISLHTPKGKIMTLQNMKAFEEHLMPYNFVRVHKSYIVPIKHIDAIENNSIQVGDKIIPIGESYSDHFYRFLGDASMNF